MREGSCMGLFYSFKTLQLSICDLNAAKLLELKGCWRAAAWVSFMYCFKTLQLSTCYFNAAKMFLLELKG
jgi:hypothetical protein